MVCIVPQAPADKVTPKARLEFVNSPTTAQNDEAATHEIPCAKVCALKGEVTDHEPEVSVATSVVAVVPEPTANTATQSFASKQEIEGAVLASSAPDARAVGVPATPATMLWA